MRNRKEVKNNIQLSDEVFVEKKEISKQYKINDEIIYEYTIKYPNFYSANTKHKLDKINLYYENFAKKIQQTNDTISLLNSTKTYVYSKKQGYPFAKNESLWDYTITLNNKGLLSLYFDNYEYEGGAHGNTIRYSNSWNVFSGRQISLSDVFKNKKHYKAYVINSIYNDITDDDKTLFFPEYKKNILKYFNEDNFYLSEKNVVIFYQLYQIAPYVAGIVTFDVPYL